MALAISSFPVPVSPWIKTVASTGATTRTASQTWCSPPVRADDFVFGPRGSGEGHEILRHRSSHFVISFRYPTMKQFRPRSHHKMEGFFTAPVAWDVDHTIAVAFG